MPESEETVTPAAEVAVEVEPETESPPEEETNPEPVELSSSEPVEIADTSSSQPDIDTQVGERTLGDFLAALKYDDTKTGVCGKICLVYQHDSGVRDTVCLCLPVPFKKLQANFDTQDVQPTAALLQAAADQRIQNNLAELLANEPHYVNFLSDEQAVASGELAYYAGKSDPAASVQKGLQYLSTHPEKMGLFAAASAHMMFLDVPGALAVLLTDPDVTKAMGLGALAPTAPPSYRPAPPPTQPPPYHGPPDAEPVVIAPTAPPAAPADDSDEETVSAGWWPAPKLRLVS